MSDFDARWQRLVTAARNAPAHPRALGVGELDRLAGLALAAGERRRAVAQQWRGFALAAAWFVIALPGLALGARAVGLAPELTGAVQELASLPRRVPSTGFLPAPPDLSRCGLPELSGASPLPWFRALDRLLTFDDAEALR